MALAVIQSIPMSAKVTLSTNMTIHGKTRFNAYTYLGLLPHALATTVAAGSADELVIATRSYFRAGSETSASKIEFVALQEALGEPVILIPEPLIQENSVSVGNRTLHRVTVEDSISREQLAVILSSNGLTRFNIVSETV